MMGILFHQKIFHARKCQVSMGQFIAICSWAIHGAENRILQRAGEISVYHFYLFPAKTRFPGGGREGDGCSLGRIALSQITT